MSQHESTNLQSIATPTHDFSSIKELKINQLTDLEDMHAFLAEDDIKMGMRTIDKGHVILLSEVDTKDFPPLLVGAFDGKFVLLGGYHRRASRKEKLEREMKLSKNPNADGEELAKILKSSLNEQQQTELEESYNQLSMPVVVKHFEKSIGLIFASQEDNLKNGLALTASSRTEMARWAWLKGEEAFINGESKKMPSYRRTADKYGIKGQTLFESVKKWKDNQEKKLQKANEKAILEETTGEEIIEENQTYDSKQAIKEASKLIKALVNFIDNTGQETTDTQRIEDISKAINQYNKKFEGKEDTEDRSMELPDLEKIAVLLLAATQPQNKNISERIAKVLHPSPKK